MRCLVLLSAHTNGVHERAKQSPKVNAKQLKEIEEGQQSLQGMEIFLQKIGNSFSTSSGSDQLVPSQKDKPEFAEMATDKNQNHEPMEEEPPAPNREELRKIAQELDYKKLFLELSKRNNDSFLI